LLRRFSHLEVTMKVEEAINYFMAIGLDSRIIAFLKNSAEELFPQKWDEKLMDNKANPFPSAWENLGIMIGKLVPGKHADDKRKIAIFSDIYYLAASCVGAPVASKFVNYCKMVNKLDMDEIIREPKKQIEIVNKMDERASLLYAIVYNIGQRWHRKEKKVTAAKVLEITEALPPEFGTSFAQHVLEVRSHELTKEKDFDRIITKFGRYFDI